jgi:hypothetical protein
MHFLLLQDLLAQKIQMRMVAMHWKRRDEAEMEIIMNKEEQWKKMKEQKRAKKGLFRVHDMPVNETFCNVFGCRKTIT